MNLFKPEDFSSCVVASHCFSQMDSIADKANDILNKHLQTCPYVYGVYKNGITKQPFGMVRACGDTHVAKLIGIEPIEEKKISISKEQLIAALEESKTRDFTLSFEDVAKKLGF